MGPIFTFDMSVVVFVVGTGAGELNGSPAVGEIAVDVFIEKFSAVIAVKTEQGKW